MPARFSKFSNLAKSHSELGGWAALRPGGFGPWRPDWTLGRLPGLSVPLLGLLATVSEPMGWDTTPEILRPFLPPEARIVSWPETGHFIHIERPREVADLVLEFLAS